VKFGEIPTLSRNGKARSIFISNTRGGLMLEKHITQLSLIAFSLLAHSTSYAADATIDSIVVTADKINSSLETSTSDILVFGPAEIAKATSITDLLRKESDLKVVQSGPMGGNTSLFLRGSDSSHTLVVIDGIVMNDPSNPNRQFDLGRLSLNNIEKIEILKGSQGLLYGSNAIGGVVVITSKSAKDGKASGSALVDYGTFNTFNSAVNIQQKFNKTALSMGVDHFKTRGFSAANINQNTNADDDGEKRTTINAGLNQVLNNENELVFNYRYTNDKVDLDKGGGPLNDDVNDSQFTEQQFMKAGYNHKWSSAETKLFYTKTLHHRTLDAQPSVTTKGDIDTVAINHTQYTTDILTQNINIDYQHEKDQLKNFNENLSLFLYNRLEFGPAIVNAGARIDSNKFFGEHLTYKIALMHFFSAFTLKMSYSTGFRAPSLNQLYDPTYGNKYLKPEESQTADMGFEVPLSDRYKYAGTIFYTDLKNRLSYDPSTFINQNRGKARIFGVENNFQSQITDTLSTDLSVTWLSARDTTSKQKLARRPNLNTKFTINYRKLNHDVGFDVDYTGKRPDIDNLGNSVQMSSYTLFNLNYDYSINQSLVSYLRIKNLLDKDYEEVFGYGTGGRSATLGLKYNF
jgi:vitamin B12 transporter